MDEFKYIPDNNVVRTARAFIHSLSQCYGSQRGLDVWDHIRKGLGDDIAGDIMMGMLSSSGVSVRLYSVGGNFINTIKEIRAFTGWGLKEAKDFADSVRDHGAKNIEVDEFNQHKVSNFINNLRANGCTVE